MAFEEVVLRFADVTAAVSPVRGAIVTRLNVAGAEVLYLDRASFDDASKNVRGGIPILFPYAGKLENGILRASGSQMGQHGFGRNRPWKVTEQSDWRVRMTLATEAVDRTAYPFDFAAEQTCSLLPRGLEVQLCIVNNGATAMPVSPGWHPYFCCPAAEKQKLRTSVKAVDASRFSDETEFDFGVPAPVNGRAGFDIPEMGHLTLSFSPEMRHLQFWSQPGKDFVCLEPFTGPANTINTDRRVDIAPGCAHTFWMKIELE